MEAQAKQILSQYYQYFQEQKWDLFAQYLHADFLYFTDKCIILPKDAFVRHLMQNQWEQTSHEIVFFSMTAAKQDQSTLSLRYKITFEGKYQGQSMLLHALETIVFIRTQQEWKIIHCHSSND